MSRIAECFAALHKARRKALIPFITAGDPAPDVTVPLMHALVNAGADIIELGVPFSDPMAEGPVIQRACERALEHGVSLTQVLEMVRSFRADNQTTPVVLMGYLNPVEVMGYRTFAKAAHDAGVDGLLTVDLPPEEAEDAVHALHKYHIDPIFLLAPTSTLERIRKVCSHASGFVYYVSLKGVTGSNALEVQTVEDKLAEIREHTKLPIGVGFGIKNAEIAAKIAQISDAVVVGSALVKLIEDNPATALQTIPALVAEMRQAMDT